MKAFLMLLILLFSSSCSKGAIGYLVVIWPPEKSALESGEIIKVISQSEIRNVYVIEKEKKIREEIPRYTGRFFSKKKEAEKFFKQYEPYIDMFAYSEASLNVRNSPDVSSGREYRLRPSQVVKVINKLPNPSVINNVSGYWIEVLTEDGFDGYCFDKNLTIYKKENVLSKEGNTEKLVNSFFDNKWYPSSYIEIINSNKIVIEKLRTGEGLFPDRDNKKIVVQTGKERIEFSFSNILFSGNNTIAFQGSPVEVIFYSAEKIYVKYTYMGIDYLSFYTTLEKHIDQYVEAEIDRRNKVMDLFYKRGRYLTSDLYGSIGLEDRRKFSWTGYVNLVPDVIPFGYGSSGTVRNNYFLSNSINKKFDGVLSFVFDTSVREIILAYFYVDNGVQFTYISEKNIENNIISSVPDDSPVLFFRQNLRPQDAE
ncbi:MAG: SH3 domain-containing protein [Spirochaetaceae bacterium]|nr:SH3 domain-containing protein [Spirochaetaceae bacterium]